MIRVDDTDFISFDEMKKRYPESDIVAEYATEGDTPYRVIGYDPTREEEGDDSPFGYAAKHRHEMPLIFTTTHECETGAFVSVMERVKLLF